MKKISIVIPTYNEEANIVEFVHQIEELFANELETYLYEVLIIDNDSTDSTRNLILNLCESNPAVKAIFNIRNYGSIRSGFYALTQTSGDCVIKIAADFQEPIDTIPKFIQAWESGYPIVVGVKHKSEESKIKYFLRSLYYRLIQKISDFEQIDQFTGFGLYDKSFINVCQNLSDSYPYFRGIVTEFGGKYAEVEYIQATRKGGVSKYRFWGLYDYAMLGITSYSKILPRLITIFAAISGILGTVISMLSIILELICKTGYSITSGLMWGTIFVFNSVHMFFLGLISEYIISINTRVMNRPLVVEEKRINFGDNKDDSIP